VALHAKNKYGFAMCGQSGSQGGAGAMLCTASEWNASKEDHRCVKCRAKIAEAKRVKERQKKLI